MTSPDYIKTNMPVYAIPPYGDALDVLLSDANVSALNRYAMVVIGGELSTNTAEVADRLTRYMNQGGKVIITIGNRSKTISTNSLTPIRHFIQGDALPHSKRATIGITWY